VAKEVAAVSPLATVVENIDLQSYTQTVKDEESKEEISS